MKGIDRNITAKYPGHNEIIVALNHLFSILFGHIAAPSNM